MVLATFLAAAFSGYLGTPWWAQSLAISVGTLVLVYDSQDYMGEVPRGTWLHAFLHLCGCLIAGVVFRALFISA
jgi:hypothetical protein